MRSISAIFANWVAAVGMSLPGGILLYRLFQRYAILAFFSPQLTILQPVAAEGIPEPGLVLYGVITSQSPVGSVRVTSGSLSWQLRPPNGGPLITVSANLTNINDQFSYFIQIPLETEIAGIPISPNTLKLGTSLQTFDRSTVTVNNRPAEFVQASQRKLLLASTDRGRLERIDLVVAELCPDSDDNGLLDCWETAHFGTLGVDPNADTDGDGMKNGDELRAGTNPRDALSSFVFIKVESTSAGTMRLEWSSVTGKKYILHRSNSLLSGYAPIATGIPATAPVNIYLDQTAADSINFYRIHIQE